MGLELSSIEAQPQWVEVGGIGLWLRMQPMDVELMLSADRATVLQRLGTSILDWNIEQHGKPVPIDLSILPGSYLPLILEAWRVLTTGVGSPLSERPVNGHGAAGTKPRRKPSKQRSRSTT